MDTMGKRWEAKRWLPVAAALLAAVGLILGGWALHRRKTVIDLEKLASFLTSSPVYLTGMRALEEEEVLSRYPGLRQGDFSDFYVYAAQDGSAREFALFQASDMQRVEDIMPALSLYCRQRESLFRQADPQEAERMRGYQIRRTRNYVLLTISDPQGSGGQLVTDFLRQSGYDLIN